MSQASFIAGDWGTTHLRLFLCDGTGNQLESAAGPGALAVRGNFANTFDSLTAGWVQRWGRLPAILCGMVGSSIGWMQTRYVPCPVDPAQLASACVELPNGLVHIVPGLSCRNRLDAPDLMRGEETQVLGALELQSELRSGQHLLCLPGTHTKWVLVRDSAIIESLTSPTGELFAAICNHTVLAEKGEGRSEAFTRGLAEFARHPRAQLLHRIFECRSRWLSGDLPADARASYLSGLLIASDVNGAAEVFSDLSADPVHVIGSSKLTHAYAQALAAMNREAHCIDGEAAALAGLTHIHVLLRQKNVAR